MLLNSKIKAGFLKITALTLAVFAAQCFDGDNLGRGQQFDWENQASCSKLISETRCAEQAGCKWYEYRDYRAGFCDNEKTTRTECSQISDRMKCGAKDYVGKKECAWLSGENNEACYERYETCASISSKSICKVPRILTSNGSCEYVGGRCESVSALYCGGLNDSGEAAYCDAANLSRESVDLALGCVWAPDEYGRFQCMKKRADCSTTPIWQCTTKGIAKNAPHDCVVVNGSCFNVEKNCGDVLLNRCKAPGVVIPANAPYGCVVNATKKDCIAVSETCEKVTSTENCQVLGIANPKVAPYGCIERASKTSCVDVKETCAEVDIADCGINGAASKIMGAPYNCIVSKDRKSCLAVKVRCDQIDSINDCEEKGAALKACFIDHAKKCQDKKEYCDGVPQADCKKDIKAAVYGPDGCFWSATNARCQAVEKSCEDLKNVGDCTNKDAVTYAQGCLWERSLMAPTTVHKCWNKIPVDQCTTHGWDNEEYCKVPGIMVDGRSCVWKTKIPFNPWNANCHNP